MTCSEAAPCLHHPTPLRRIECRWNLLPPEQPREVILYSQWRRRYNTILGHSASDHRWHRKASGSSLKRGVNGFLEPASPIEPSRGINQTSNAGKPEASATGTNPFSCSERRLFHPRASEVKGTSDNTGEKLQTPLVRSKHLFSPIINMSRHPRPDPSRRKAT